MTPFGALSRLVRAEACGESSDPDLLPEAATWSKGQYASILQGADKLAGITAAAGPCFDHPYFGMHATMLQPAELSGAPVNGYAFGGGFETALSCDIRLGSENAPFAAPQITLGW